MLLVGLSPGNFDSMIVSRRALLLVFGVFITLAVGAASVHASPVCERLVRVYKEKMVPNRVSRTTQARWSEWNKTHPNFHPKPRPKYKLTPEEVAQKMDFDCQVPVDPIELAIEIPPQLPVAPPTDLFPTPTLPNVVQATSSTPQPFAPLGASAAPAPLNIGAVPEPPSLVFALTGVAFLVTLTGARRSRAYPI
jgi:hypothetical protein